ncbi:MAG: zonular occludens toxin domain-containing protein [Nitrososphaerales archaeon]
MSDEQLLQLVALDLAAEQEDLAKALEQLLNKITFVSGKKGKGKTAFAVAASYNIRELFGRPVVCVGSRMGLRPEFGPFDYIPEAEFKEELAKITLVANEDENAEHVAEVFRRRGIHLIGSVVVFDEAYKLMNARTPQDKLVKLTVQFVSQIRHYDCTAIVLAPDISMVDKLIRLQFDWTGQAFYNPYTGVVVVHLTYGLDTLNFEIDLFDDSLHPAYASMYNTRNIVGYRAASLNIKESQL